MKLRNKQTGEIIDLTEGCIKDCTDFISLKPVAVLEKEYIYNSLAELNEEWEDYEEPLKPYWFINDLDGEPMKCELKNCRKSNFIEWGNHRKQIDNYFETKEEAEKAVEKLKAWKRLKDKGFRFDDFSANAAYFTVDGWWIGKDEFTKDMNLLFGGEE